jgi:hypothetical protein
MISKTAILRIAAMLSAMASAGCTTPTEILALRCDVYVDDLDPQIAEVGESVVLTGSPYTSVYDSAVYVGDTRATVTAVDRDGCTTCDSCRAQFGCTECGDCDVCDRECTVSCVETVTFTVPDVSDGDQRVQLFNGHGQSHVVELTVLDTSPVDDSGNEDTGPADTGSDSGTPATGAIHPLSHDN